MVLEPPKERKGALQKRVRVMKGTEHRVMEGTEHLVVPNPSDSLAVFGKLQNHEFLSVRDVEGTKRKLRS